MSLKLHWYIRYDKISLITKGIANKRHNNVMVICRELLDKNVTPEIQESKYISLKKVAITLNLNENNQLDAKSAVLCITHYAKQGKVEATNVFTLIK